MNTPITASADDYQIRAVAQKLERDRAALMEALEKVEATDQKLPAHVWRSVLSALAAARANFPEQP